MAGVLITCFCHHFSTKVHKKSAGDDSEMWKRENEFGCSNFFKEIDSRS